MVGPRGDAIIDHNCDAAGDVEARAVAKIALPSALDLGELPVARCIEVGLIDADDLNDLLVADVDRGPAVDDRSHRELRLGWHTDLSHQDEIQRRVEPGCDLSGDGNAAARQCQDHRSLILVAGKSLGEQGAGIRSILEAHGVNPGACQDGVQTRTWHAR